MDREDESGRSFQSHVRMIRKSSPYYHAQVSEFCIIMEDLASSGGLPQAFPTPPQKKEGPPSEMGRKVLNALHVFRTQNTRHQVPLQLPSPWFFSEIPGSCSQLLSHWSCGVQCGSVPKWKFRGQECWAGELLVNGGVTTQTAYYAWFQHNDCLLFLCLHH